MVEAVEALSIGSIVGGRTSWTLSWSEAIRELTNEIARARDGVVSPLNVNVVFHLPGHLLKPDYSGVRTGRFSRKLSLLMVQVALPEEAPSDIRGALHAYMLEALCEAERWAKRKKIAGDLDALKRLVH